MSIYRPLPKPIDRRFIRARGGWHRFLCAVIGHRWRTLSRDMWRAMCCAHLFSRSGEECLCTRCGRHEDDRSIEARIALDGGAL